MAQHTMGPWMVCAERPNEIQLDDRDGEAVFPLIATVEMDNTATGQGLADARLIAAAPDLLAVVKALAAVTDYSLPRSDVASLVMNARAALAKAEGRA